MKTKQITALICALCLCAAVFSGCANKAPNGTESMPPVSQTPGSEAPDNTPKASGSDMPNPSEEVSGWSEPKYGEKKDFTLEIEGTKETVSMTYMETDFAHWPGAPGVAMFIDRERYTCSVFEGEYDIVPIGSDGDPVGRLHFYPAVGKTAQELLDETKEWLEENDMPLTDEGTAELDNYSAPYISFSDATVYLIDYNGGCIVLSIRIHNPEAAEGHGARLALMARTITILD